MAVETIRGSRSRTTRLRVLPSRRRTIQRVLVANRGEIARRLFRASGKLGLQSVAVYSDADAGSVWSRQADLSVRLPGNSSSATYLNGDAILAAARRVGADAIHPGYGFLSENAEFAEACIDAGFAFVGPRPDIIRLMGSKTAGREAALAAGVPVVPGFDGAGLTDEDIAREAECIGYPILIKAAAGGGGRGMRIAESAELLADALLAARTEAQSAFGNEDVLIERYFRPVRHVEVQLLGDDAGGLVHLFERECSIQRRYQKLIEESPAPGLSTEQRRDITAAAVALAREVGYNSAGTVEFLIDPDGNYYFIEMNTRLQVEHGVTELVTGLDLAAWQIRIAAGERLDIPQEALQIQRHAIECRVYAEDPERGFMPSVGRIDIYRAPSGPGIRCDDCIAAGSTVSPHYDALLAKVMVSGYDRRDALRLMEQALAETVILGVVTNLPYLQDIVASEAFRIGELSTTFLDEHFACWSAPAAEEEEQWLALAAFEYLTRTATDTSRAPNGGLVLDPWAVSGSWRNVP